MSENAKRMAALEQRLAGAIRGVASAQEEFGKIVEDMSEMQRELAELRKLLVKAESDSKKRRRTVGHDPDEDSIASEVKATSAHHRAQVLCQDAAEKLRRAKELEARNAAMADNLKRMRADVLAREAAVTTLEEKAAAAAASSSS